MSNFFKKYWEDMIIYSFCGMMVIAGVMIYYVFVK